MRLRLLLKMGIDNLHADALTKVLIDLIRPSLFAQLYWDLGFNLKSDRLTVKKKRFG